MSIRVYNNRYINIYKVKNNAFIIHNTRKRFEEGHTHIKNFKTAKYLTYLVVHKKVPNKMNNFLLDSLIRIADGKEYKKMLKEMRNKNE